MAHIMRTLTKLAVRITIDIGAVELCDFGIPGGQEDFFFYFPSFARIASESHHFIYTTIALSSLRTQRFGNSLQGEEDKKKKEITFRVEFESYTAFVLLGKQQKKKLWICGLRAIPCFLPVRLFVCLSAARVGGHPNHSPTLLHHPSEGERGRLN